MEERLQKILARAGLGSRRACEELIRQGRVQVNGEIAQIGQKADPHGDRIVVDGRPIREKQHYTYIALYKPPGVLSSAGGARRSPTARDLIPLSTRLYPVGRSDLWSEGLLLLTDDGTLTLELTHPRYEHTYPAVDSVPLECCWPDFTAEHAESAEKISNCRKTQRPQRPLR